MPNLIETYARSTGLKIDKPWLKEDFWPLPFDKFITLSAGSGQAAKNYSHWQIVIDLLNPIFQKYNIRIIQLGDKDTPLFSGTYDLRGKMNIAQSTFLLNRALLHMGNDSWSAHVSGALQKPLVAVYGTTDKIIHGPHWQNKDITILLESHRYGRKPTFGAENFPKSIDLIKPEEIAISVLKLLKVEESINYNTLLIGNLFPHNIFDWIPNSNICLNLNKDIPIVARMDIEFNENELHKLLQTGRKVTILTNKSINLNLLATFRNSILSYNHELINEECSLDYIFNLKRIVQNVVFFTKESNESKIADLRFKFFDVCSIQTLPTVTKDNFLQDTKKYLDKEIDLNTNLDKMMFKTNKVIMSKEKIYISYAHLDKDMPLNDFNNKTSNIIDDKKFWADYAHFIIYTN